MATEAPATPELLAKFGPQRGYQAGERFDTSVDPDRLVKTHCCFCDQQCGIQLKVKGNTVVGFEPWLDFPFNKGMLCPKGVRRYLQSSHRDRLTSAHFRGRRRPRASGPSRTARRSAASRPRSGASSPPTATTPSACWAART